MKNKKNKYLYLKVIQCYIDGVWCDETFYDKDDLQQIRDMRRDIRDYRANDPGTPYRIIERRVPNDGRQIHA